MTMRRPHALLARAVALLLLVWAAPAAALCPNCLGQGTTNTPGLRLLGLFVLIPPAVFFAVAVAIRKMVRGANGKR
jgi:hypothetical protein